MFFYFLFGAAIVCLGFLADLEKGTTFKVVIRSTVVDIFEISGKMQSKFYVVLVKLFVVFKFSILRAFLKKFWQFKGVCLVHKAFWRYLRVFYSSKCILAQTLAFFQAWVSASFKVNFRWISSRYGFCGSNDIFIRY